MLPDNNTIQKAFNTRMEIAEKKYPKHIKKEIVLFNPKKTTEVEQQEAYIAYSDKMLEYFDDNKDGKVDKGEYQQGLLKLYYESHKERYNSPNDERNLIKRRLTHLGERSFKALDTNGDNIISKEEYAVFTKMCDAQGGIDGKFILDDEEATLHEIHVNNPFKY